jgi:hypothetical protein
MFTSKTRAGRHSAKRSSSVTRTALTTTAVFAVAIGGALAATGTTYALWNDNVAPLGSTVSTGSTGLTVENVGAYAIPGLSTTKLYPGTSVFTMTPLTLKNTGTTPLAITPAAATFTSSTNGMSGYLAVAVRPDTACGASAVGVTPVSVGIPRIEVGQSIQVCVEVRLSATAPASVQGGSATFSLQLDALQVR